MHDEALPRKWLDKKQYVRVEPATGLPQLIRVEPMVQESGRFIPEKVLVYVDEDLTVLDREAAEAFISSLDCIPIEAMAQWRQGSNS